jgi:hypothetical protein
MGRAFADNGNSIGFVVIALFTVFIYSRRQQTRDLSVWYVIFTKKWPRSVKNPSTFSFNLSKEI